MYILWKIVHLWKKIGNLIYDTYIFSFYDSNLFQEKIYV